jgi:hypothetical protein
VLNKYKTFSVLIYSYINTSGNWENEKLCGNGRSVFTQFRVFTISTSVDITVCRVRIKHGYGRTDGWRTDGRMSGGRTDGFQKMFFSFFLVISAFYPKG